MIRPTGHAALCMILLEHARIIMANSVGESVWDLDFRAVSFSPSFKNLSIDHIVPACTMTLARLLQSVIFRVRQTTERSGRRSDQVRVMAVSRTKPVPHIWQVRDVSHRCFGESYVQEMNERAPQLPKDIEWYFIGHLGWLWGLNAIWCWNPIFWDQGRAIVEEAGVFMASQIAGGVLGCNCRISMDNYMTESLW